jgi:hypothetical protein
LVTYFVTVTIIPFMPNGWAASAGGFPAMAGNVPFLMKDVVLFAASVYLLKAGRRKGSGPGEERLSLPRLARGLLLFPQTRARPHAFERLFARQEK